MIQQNLNSLCTEASKHYFDIACERLGENVPKTILTHIQQCDHCRTEIEQLKIALASEEPNEQAQKQKDNTLAAALELHYAYTGLPVRCGHVKPFLPSLADPTLEVRVPTPITAHIDNCTQCAEDLETIRKLNLPHKQLCRLGQLFAEKFEANITMCDETKKALPFMARLDFEGLPPEMLRHVCLCPSCRTALYDQRIAAMQRPRIPEQIPQVQCDHILTNDLFDYTIPYGLEPENSESLKSGTSLASHAAIYPDCFAKIQDLHRTIFQILERPQSDVVTKFNIDRSVARGEHTSSKYGDWPISVEITHKFAAWNGIEKRFAAANLKRFVKPAAAAIILFALVFYFVNTPIARAVDLAGIYKAVATITNVHIATFVPPQTESPQEQWISKTLNISIFKTPTEMIVWDVQNSSRRVKNISTSAIDITPLSRDSAADIEKQIRTTPELLPFNDLSELPADAKWQQVTDVDTKSVAPNTKVYDLTWAEKSAGGLPSLKKWRAFVDTTANLPQRVETYQKRPGDADYVLKSYMLVDYISEGQMQTVIQEAAF